LAQSVVASTRSSGNFSYKVDHYAFDAGTGLNEDTVRYISSVKKEAPWILISASTPCEGNSFDAIAHPLGDEGILENILFRENPVTTFSQGQKPKRTVDEVPDDIKKTFERLGIPEAGAKFLAGVEAQFDSEPPFEHQGNRREKQGVIFVNSTEGRASIPELFREILRGKSFPPVTTNSPCSTARCSSGGSFHLRAESVKVSRSRCRLTSDQCGKFGQFERHAHHRRRRLGGCLHGGCTAPKFTTSTLHSAVVELVALKARRSNTSPSELGEQRGSISSPSAGVAHEDAEIQMDRLQTSAAGLR